MCSASTPEECCFFYSLLACSPRNATKLELSVPETLVLHRGSVHSWIFTNKDGHHVRRCFDSLICSGYVNSRSSTNTTLDGTVERKLLAAAKRECRGCSFVAVEHRGHTIRALNEQALARLSVRLSTAATKPMSSGEVKMLPHYLHTFVAASQELRYTVRLSVFSSSAGDEVMLTACGAADDRGRFGVQCRALRVQSSGWSED